MTTNNPPHYEKSTRPLVAFAIVSDTNTCRILVVRQSGSNQCWMLPGGFVGVGEEPLVCCERELKEESGFKISLHHTSDPRYFHNTFDFSRVPRQKIFQKRGTPGETIDFGFVRLLRECNPAYVVESYNGMVKSHQELRGLEPSIHAPNHKQGGLTLDPIITYQHTCSN